MNHIARRTVREDRNRRLHLLFPQQREDVFSNIYTGRPSKKNHLSILVLDNLQPAALEAVLGGHLPLGRVPDGRRERLRGDEAVEVLLPQETIQNKNKKCMSIDGQQDPEWGEGATHLCNQIHETSGVPNNQTNHAPAGYTDSKSNTFVHMQHPCERATNRMQHPCEKATNHIQHLRGEGKKSHATSLRGGGQPIQSRLIFTLRPEADDGPPPMRKLMPLMAPSRTALLTLNPGC